MEDSKNHLEGNDSKKEVGHYFYSFFHLIVPHLQEQVCTASQSSPIYLLNCISCIPVIFKRIKSKVGRVFSNPHFGVVRSSPKLIPIQFCYHRFQDCLHKSYSPRDWNHDASQDDRLETRRLQRAP